MSDQEIINRINSIQLLIGDINNAKDELLNYDVTKLKNAGSNQWSGEKREKFLEKYESVRGAIKSTESNLNSARQDCRVKIQSLAAHIEDPSLKMQYMYAGGYY